MGAEMDKWYKRCILSLLLMLIVLLILVNIYSYFSIRDLRGLTKNLKDQVGDVQKYNRKLSFIIQKIEPTIGRYVYAPRRQTAIRFQAKQVPKGGIVIVGDSITDLFWTKEICGLPVLNSGVSGAGVDWHLQYVSETLILSKPKIAVIAIGINDALTPDRISVADFEKEWTLLYEKVNRQYYKFRDTCGALYNFTC
jgi:hypothetical protein